MLLGAARQHEGGKSWSLNKKEPKHTTEGKTGYPTNLSDLLFIVFPGPVFQTRKKVRQGY